MWLKLIYVSKKGSKGCCWVQRCVRMNGTMPLNKISQMFNPCSEDFKWLNITNIFIFYFSTMAWHMRLKSFLPEERNTSILTFLHSQYNGCWWHGNVSGRASSVMTFAYIMSHGIFSAPDFFFIQCALTCVFVRRTVAIALVINLLWNDATYIYSTQTFFKGSSTLLLTPLHFPSVHGVPFTCQIRQ